MHYTAHYLSPLGAITLASDGTALIGLWFDGQKYFANTLEDTAKKKNLSLFTEVAHWLDLYFNGIKPNFLPPLAPKATPFRKKVWDCLHTVAYGKTISYGEIAVHIGKKNACRAVGAAVSHNPIAIIVPCHRVIASNGNLTGYVAGIEKKRRLLLLEGIDV